MIRGPWACVYCLERFEKGTLTLAESDAAKAAWSQLKKENAPLRVVRDGQLISTPLTYFDDVKTEQASSKWEVTARLIRRVLQHLSTEADPLEKGVNDELLFPCILALGDAGVLESMGSGHGMRHYHVRRPTAA